MLYSNLFEPSPSSQLHVNVDILPWTGRRIDSQNISWKSVNRLHQSEILSACGWRMKDIPLWKFGEVKEEDLVCHLTLATNISPPITSTEYNSLTRSASGSSDSYGGGSYGGGRDACGLKLSDAPMACQWWISTRHSIMNQIIKIIFEQFSTRKNWHLTTKKIRAQPIVQSKQYKSNPVPVATNCNTCSSNITRVPLCMCCFLGVLWWRHQ